MYGLYILLEIVNRWIYRFLDQKTLPKPVKHMKMSDLPKMGYTDGMMKENYGKKRLELLGYNKNIRIFFNVYRPIN